MDRQNKYGHRGFRRGRVNKPTSLNRYSRRRTQSENEKYDKYEKYYSRRYEPAQDFVSPYIREAGSSRVQTFFEKKRKRGIISNQLPPYERSVDMLRRYRESPEYYSEQREIEIEIENYKKPQREWNISNDTKRFEPDIVEKPNAEELLEVSMSINAHVSPEIEDVNISPLKNGHNGLGGPVTFDSMPHPYMKEISTFQYMNAQLEVDNSIDLLELNKCFEHRSIEFVDTTNRLKEIVQYLEGQREFAVSCQQHTYRSFQGFVCLFQISTYYKDYVIDAIKLRKDMHLLNRPFTNPEIVKVIYNADQKLLWLQRDFSLYMVNVFDIMFAADVFFKDEEKRKLSYLLNKYYSVELGPDLEAFDWRFRPIPSEMVFYLMSTTYFLVLLYHELKRELMDKYRSFEAIGSVFDMGRVQCQRRYEKVLKIDERVLSKKFMELDYTEPQKKMYTSLYKLRDKLARKYDESWRYYIDDDELEFLCTHVIDEVEEDNFPDIVLFYKKSHRIPVLLVKHLPEVLEIIREYHPKSWKNVEDSEEEDSDEVEEGEVGERQPKERKKPPTNDYPPEIRERLYYSGNEGGYESLNSREVFERVNWGEESYRPFYSHSRRKTLSFDASDEVSGARRKSFFTGMVRDPYGGGGTGGGKGKEQIPSSLNQIYEMSQISRRKNSQKKKKKKKELVDNWKKKHEKSDDLRRRKEEEENKEVIKVDLFLDDIGWEAVSI